MSHGPELVVRVGDEVPDGLHVIPLAHERRGDEVDVPLDPEAFSGNPRPVEQDAVCLLSEGQAGITGGHEPHYSGVYTLGHWMQGSLHQRLWNLYRQPTAFRDATNGG